MASPFHAGQGYRDRTGQERHHTALRFCQAHDLQPTREAVLSKLSAISPVFRAPVGVDVVPSGMPTRKSDFDLGRAALMSKREVYDEAQPTASCPCTCSAGSSCSAPTFGPPTRTPPCIPGLSSSFQVGALRKAWPDARILFRADSGFCRPHVFEWCERNGVEYITGIGENSALRIMAKLWEAMSDRTSCRKWWSNQFRLRLSSMAFILVETIRRLGLADTKQANAQAGTIRGKLFKVVAVIIRNTRRVRLHLSSFYPNADLFMLVARRLAMG